MPGRDPVQTSRGQEGRPDEEPEPERGHPKHRREPAAWILARPGHAAHSGV